MLANKFKEKLKKEGRNIKWFYDKKIKGQIDLTYSGFTAQLNGYAPISEEIEIKLHHYIKSEN